jgi:hypothetical protein
MWTALLCPEPTDFYRQEFKKVINKIYFVDNFIIALLYMCHMVRRWYTSDFYLDVIHIYTFVPPWHQSIYHNVKKIVVSFLQPGSDSLLHFGVSYKSLFRYAFLQVYRWKSLGARTGLYGT